MRSNGEFPHEPLPNDPNHPVIKAFHKWAEEDAKLTLETLNRNVLAGKLTP